MRIWDDRSESELEIIRLNRVLDDIKRHLATLHAILVEDTTDYRIALCARHILEIIEDDK